jgi:hypothetical protein
MDILNFVFALILACGGPLDAVFICDFDGNCVAV